MIGRVATVNPAKREIRVTPVGRELPLMDEVDRVYVAGPDGAEFCCRTQRIREHGGQLIIELAPGVLRDTVAQLRQGAVSIAADKIRTREQLDFGGEALLGFFVETADGERVGRVSAVIETAAHDVLEIEAPNGGCLLAPLVEEMIDAIDWDAMVLRVKDLSAFAVHQESDPTTRTV
jgi:ribosomal 30S subunit maturation factor RimM